MAHQFRLVLREKLTHRCVQRVLLAVRDAHAAFGFLKAHVRSRKFIHESENTVSEWMSQRASVRRVCEFYSLRGGAGTFAVFPT